MPTSKLAAVEFALHWTSANARHTERLYFEKLNFWRDFFPGSLAERLGATEPGTAASESFAAGELVAPWGADLIQRVRPEQIRLQLRTGEPIIPRTGRFYPRGMVAGLPDVFSGDRRPLRYLGEHDGFAHVDLNHPLARFPLTVAGRIVQSLGTAAETGGRAQDVPLDLTSNGPGMQVPHPDVATDFESDDPFARLDERADKLFYYQPRLVQHLDSHVRGQISALYGRLLTPGMKVLDLMSSWVSHLPDALDLEVTGLGLNADELGSNPRLTTRTVHDLNEDPSLPCADGAFDAAICTASVEYLVNPVKVFQSVRRVLKPGAPFVLTFSERWFPPKVIQLWPAIHPFERVGLVLEYLRRAGGFADLETESARGWPRPADDKYAGQFPDADPLYAVWGRAV
jgi:SAM-dependent methyltransferase